MKLHISSDISLPLDSATQTFAILAKRRVGKTYTASVIAEEYVKAKLPFVALDPTGAWWGLRSGKDGKVSGGLPVYVIGGEHGIPLEPTAGRVIAEQVAIHPAYYVIDVSGFESNAAQDRFATDFAERFYRIKDKHRQPMHLFIDEADAFIPQRPMPGQQRMLGAFEALVRRGGIRGIGVTLISQRAAVVNKNVLEQTECLIALQTTGPNDQDAIDNWIKRNGTPEERETLMSSLASLGRGEAWVYSPGWLEVFKRVHIRERETFNSSATPESGAKIKQAALLPVDLDKLSAEIKATVEKAKANDPELLRRRIRELEGAKPKLVDEAAISRAMERAKAEAQRESASRIRALETLVAKQQATMKRAAESLIGAAVELPAIPAPLPPLIPRQVMPSPLRTIAPGEPAIKINSGARRLLEALVQWHPKGMSEGQWRAHARLRKTGTFTTYRSMLKSGGLIEQRGSEMFATQTGVDFFGESVPQTPSDTQSMLDLWLPKLGAGPGKMLQVLIANRGEPVTNAELAEACGWKITGTYTTYRSKLVSAGLAVSDRGSVRANKETLFL